jgi:hypothetical protein
MEMARAMMKSMSVPGKFWGEVVRHAIYLLNRIPTKALSDQTPFEAWYKKKPHLGHLRVFGCLAHVKPAVPYTKKLEDRSSHMVYFGVEEGSKAHRMSDPLNKKIVVSRDVIFEESVQWKWGSVLDVPTNEFTIEDEALAGNSDWGAGIAGGGVMQPGGEVPIVVIDSNSSARSGARVVPNELQSSDGATELLAGGGTPSLAGPMQVGEHSASGSTTENENKDSPPMHYRNLANIYDNTSEVKLELDSEGETLLAKVEEPTSYSEAAGNPEWELAMENEIQSIVKNKTWTLTELPPGHRPIGLKWVFKLKKNADGEVSKHKAKLVAKGYVQKQGIEYDEVFAPVARIDTMKLILAMAANRGWEVHHLDVKLLFLNGELEEVDVVQPKGYAVKEKE